MRSEFCRILPLAIVNFVSYNKRNGLLSFVSLIQTNPQKKATNISFPDGHREGLEFLLFSVQFEKSTAVFYLPFLVNGKTLLKYFRNILMKLLSKLDIGKYFFNRFTTY